MFIVVIVMGMGSTVCHVQSQCEMKKQKKIIITRLVATALELSKRVKTHNQFTMHFKLDSLDRPSSTPF
jgi:hypothetical protein